MTNVLNTEATENEVVFSRFLNAPRARVFKAWIDPQQLARWWGPHGFAPPSCELDVRPGGAYRIVMRSQDGTEYPIKGTYREIAEPERLVMTMDCSEHPDEWHRLINPYRREGENSAGEMLLTVTFEEQNGKTKLTIRTQFESEAIREAMTNMGMAEGWGQSLERLEEHLAKPRNLSK